MLSTLVAVWSLPFLFALLVFVCLESAVAYNDSPGWGVFIAVVLIGLMVAFSDFNPLAWVVAHYVLFALCLAGYFVIGVAYAFLRWSLLIHDHSPEGDYVRRAIKPGVALDPGDYRQRIETWIALWWAVMLGRVLRWPWRFVAWLYEHIRASFKRMAEAAAKPV